MKIRIFKKLQNGVFDVRAQTEDWSENDKQLMVKYGEPEICLGGTFAPNEGSSSDDEDNPEIIIPNTYARVMTESPFTQKIDSRDCNGSISNAQAIARLWASTIEDRIAEVVSELRTHNDSFTTEEVSEI